MLWSCYRDILKTTTPDRVKGATCSQELVDHILEQSVTLTKPWFHEKANNSDHWHPKNITRCNMNAFTNSIYEEHTTDLESIGYMIDPIQINANNELLVYLISDIDYAFYLSSAFDACQNTRNTLFTKPHLCPGVSLVKIVGQNCKTIFQYYHQTARSIQNEGVDHSFLSDIVVVQDSISYKKWIIIPSVPIYKANLSKDGMYIMSNVSLTIIPESDFKNIIRNKITEVSDFSKIEKNHCLLTTR